MVIKKAFCKVKNKGLDGISKISADIFGTELTNVEFIKEVWGSENKFQNLEQVQKYFRERKELRVFVDLSKQERIVRLIYERFPDAPGEITAEADRIWEQIFDLLGSGAVKVYYGMKAKGFEAHCYNTQINRKKLTAIRH